MNYNQEQIAFPVAYHQWHYLRGCDLFEYFRLTTGSGRIRLHNAASPVFFTNISYDKGNKRVMLFECGDEARIIEDAEDTTLYEVLIKMGFGQRGWGDNSREDVVHTIRIEECDDDQMTVVNLLNTPVSHICSAQILNY
jgi:hypothetical protein